MRALLLVLLLSACHLQPSYTGLRAVAPPTVLTREECAVVDRNQLGWSVSAILFGVLGGGGGGVTALVPDNTPKYVVGSVSLVLGVFTGLSSFLATFYTKQYADNCTFNTGGR